jgi:hypothetical protein
MESVAQAVEEFLDVDDHIAERPDAWEYISMVLEVCTADRTVVVMRCDHRPASYWVKDGDKLGPIETLADLQPHALADRIARDAPGTICAVKLSAGYRDRIRTKTWTFVSGPGAPEGDTIIETSLALRPPAEHFR